MVVKIVGVRILCKACILSVVISRVNQTSYYLLQAHRMYLDTFEM